MNPVLKDEVQFLAWGDGPQGPWIKLKLPDSDDLGPFRGMTQAKATMAGQRMACVLVEIGDDETPVAPPEPKEKTGPLCLLAVRWCQEAPFQSWAYRFANAEGVRYGATEEGAKQFICDECGIQSRKEIDTNPKAADKFHRLIRIPYMKHMEGK